MRFICIGRAVQAFFFVCSAFSDFVEQVSQLI